MNTNGWKLVGVEDRPKTGQLILHLKSSRGQTLKSRNWYIPVGIQTENWRKRYAVNSTRNKTGFINEFIHKYKMWRSKRWFHKTTKWFLQQRGLMKREFE